MTSNAHVAQSLTHLYEPILPGEPPFEQTTLEAVDVLQQLFYPSLVGTCIERRDENHILTSTLRAYQNKTHILQVEVRFSRDASAQYGWSSTLWKREIALPEKEKENTHHANQ